ncbi:MAG: hypothetical protein ACKV0T_09445, partial [Planctomycetales bacterium]
PAPFPAGRTSDIHFRSALSWSTEPILDSQNRQEQFKSRERLPFFRKGLILPENVAIGDRAKPGKKYYVAVVPAAAILEMGLTIATDAEIPPTGRAPNPAHAVIPELNATLRREESTIDFARRIAYACSEVLGPYSVAAPRSHPI